MGRGMALGRICDGGAAMKPMRIAFLHPNLGLGGAERLIVDAARALQQVGHKTTIFTSRYDPESAFAETRELDVRVVPTRVPESIGGRFLAPATILRMRRIANKLASERGAYDVVVCDLTAHVIPDLQRSLAVPVAFYCHYPDSLLTSRPNTGIYGSYRKGIDASERRGLEAADCVMVNSAFTARRYVEEFQGIEPPHVVYPGADVEAYQGISPIQASGEILLLSVNRFRAPKALDRAVGALAALPSFIADQTWKRVRLVLAGGYEESLPDARETVAGLKGQVERLGLVGKVDWVFNPSEPERLALLGRARCLLYTPSDEHFGLGPIEAMAAARPVVAVNSGGPLETIVEGETGRLRSPEPDALAEGLSVYVESPETAREHGLAGRIRVARHFSLDRFRDSLEQILGSLVSERTAT